MRMRTFAAVLAVASLTSVRSTGQTRTVSPTFPAPAATAKSWMPPHTAWGDPDISGNFTNLYEVGTPFERPDEFVGRQLGDVRGAELAAIRKGIEQRTRAEQLAGDVGGTRWIWLDSFDHAKASVAWFVVDPPDGKVPPMTPEGQARMSARAAARRASGRGPADGPEDRSLYDRCITRGLPGSMMPAIYGDSYRIVQSRDAVAIQYEMVHEARIIPLDGRPHLTKNLRLDMGDGRGHWEGDTLVVETSNFRERSVYRNANPVVLKLTERFTRVAPDKVRWAVTVDDPSTWTQPWTFAMPLTLNDKEPMMPYECHEGNYAMRNILSGARAEEKAGRASSASTDEER
jgi:hypothetical protein